MTEEEILRSIQLLRERRQTIPELRDYKPGGKKGSKDTTQPARDPGEVFKSLFTQEEE